MAARRKYVPVKAAVVRKKRALQEEKLRKMMASEAASRAALIAALTRWLRDQETCCDEVTAYLAKLSIWLENTLAPAVDFLLTQVGGGGTVQPTPKFP